MPKDSIELTEKELAERWGITRNGLVARRRRGRVPKFKRCGDCRTAQIKYKLSDVLAFERKFMKPRLPWARVTGE